MNSNFTFIKLKYNFQYDFVSRSYQRAVEPIKEFYNNHQDVAIFVLYNMAATSRELRNLPTNHFFEFIKEDLEDKQYSIVFRDLDNEIIRLLTEGLLTEQEISNQINTWIIIADEIFETI